MQTLGYVRVWYPSIRLFHWILSGGFVIAYISGDGWLSLHVLAGYIILGLLVYRLICGMAGSRYARFSNLFCHPSTVLDYLHDLMLGQARRYLGYNPAGAAMVVTLLIFLLVTCVSGLLVYGLEHQAGPLAGWLQQVSNVWEGSLEELHQLLANSTLFLILVHVTGVVANSVLQGENLVHAKFTERKHIQRDNGAEHDKTARK